MIDLQIWSIYCCVDLLLPPIYCSSIYRPSIYCLNRCSRPIYNLNDLHSKSMTLTDLILRSIYTSNRCAVSIYTLIDLLHFFFWDDLLVIIFSRLDGFTLLHTCMLSKLEFLLPYGSKSMVLMVAPSDRLTDFVLDVDMFFTTTSLLHNDKHAEG